MSEFGPNPQEQIFHRKENPPVAPELVDVLEFKKDKNNEVLELAVAQRVMDWSDSWLREYFDSCDNVYSVASQEIDLEHVNDQVQRVDLIDKQIKIIVETDGHSTNNQFQRGVAIFLDCFLKFINERMQHGGEINKIRNFIEKITPFVLEIPPLCELLPLNEEVNFVSQATRCEPLAEAIGVGLIGDLESRLTKSKPEDIDGLCQFAFELPVGEVLDLIHICESVGMYTRGLAEIAEVDDYEPSDDGQLTIDGVDEKVFHTSRQRVWDAVGKILDELQQKHPLVFVQYAAKYAEQRMRTGGPSMYDPITLAYSNDSNLRAPIHDRGLERDYQLRHQIRTEFDFGQYGHLIKIASDAIGVIDSSGRILYYGVCDLSKLSPLLGVDVETLEGYIQGLEDGTYQKNVGKFWHPVLHGDEEGKIFKTLISDTGQLFGKPDSKNFWAQISNILTTREWEAYFSRRGNKQEIAAGTKLRQNSAQFQRDVVNYLKSYIQDCKKQVQTAPLVVFKPFKEISEDTGVNPFSGGRDGDWALLLQHLHRPGVETQIEDDLGLSLGDIPFSSQIQLLSVLGCQTREGFSRISDVFIQTEESARPDLAVSFLVCAEDKVYGGLVLELAEQLQDSPALLKKVFSTYREIVDKTQAQAKEIFEKVQQDTPGSPITVEEIVQGLLVRGRDLLFELNASLLDTSTSRRRALVDDFIQELKKETAEDQATRAHFKKIAQLLGGADIDLAGAKRTQSLALHSLEKGGGKAMLLRVLQRMDRLAPIPEIHWRVDRSLEEYSRRFGIDVSKFLDLIATPGDKKTLLEFGPGNGLSKRERSAGQLGKLYDDFAMADKVYYPVGETIGRLLDFEKLEKDLGQALTPAERKLLSEFVYKALYIKQGETARDNFSYDTEVVKEITKDPNALKDLLKNVGQRLAAAEEIPQTISTRNERGEVIYPYKIQGTDQSAAWQKAKQLLAESPQVYLDDTVTDVYEEIDAFPAGVMVGDFSDVKKLQSDQVDVVLGVRSTVYVRGKEYVDLMREVGRILTQDGVLIDDSVRDNDGWYYRLAELAEVQASNPDLKISIMLGPGFKGEDYQQNDVPLAIFMTKGETSYEEAIKKTQLGGYKLVRLEEIIKDTKYLQSLDKTGHTYEEVEKSLGASAGLNLAA